MEEAFKKISKGKRWFNGDKIGYLDMAFGSHLGWLKATEKSENLKLFDEKKTPNLVEWAQCFLSDDNVKKVMPEIDKFVEYGHKLKIKWGVAN